MKLLIQKVLLVYQKLPWILFSYISIFRRLWFFKWKSFEEIIDFLNNKNLDIENVLSMYGGTISDNILAIRINFRW